jgi:hypothetical protein
MNETETPIRATIGEPVSAGAEFPGSTWDNPVEIAEGDEYEDEYEDWDTDPVALALAQVRVARGAAYMDRYYPGWFERLDTSERYFDLGNPSQCVLGQIDPDGYIGASDKLILRVTGRDDYNGSVVREHAFIPLDDLAYGQTEELWREAIRDRTMQKVADGAALLDKHVPEWRERIRPDRLSMSSDSFCIMGQQFGEYHTGVLWARKVVDPEFDPEEYGFVTPCDPNTGYDMCEYRHLDAAWTRILVEGR